MKKNIWNKKIIIIFTAITFLLILFITIFQIISISKENQKEYVKKKNVEIFEQINHTYFRKIDEVTKILSKDLLIEKFCSQNNIDNYNSVLIQLNTIQKSFGLELCFILDSTGTVIASGKYPPDPNLNIDIEGDNYSFRQYYIDAMKGENVVYPALGTTTNVRGVYFSSPIVSSENRVIGVVVCKINIDIFDNILKKYSGISAISTDDGIIFSANNNDLLYKSLNSLTKEKHESILKLKQFGDMPIEPLGLTINKNSASLNSKDYFISQHPIGDLGWNLLTMDEYKTYSQLNEIQKKNIFVSVIVLSILLVTITILISDKFKMSEIENMQKNLFVAVQQSSSTILISDIKGNVQYVNPKFSKITGYSQQEIIRKNTNILKSGYHDQEFYKNFWTTILSGEDWRGTFCNKRKDGTIYWEDTLVSSVKDNKGKISSFIAIKEDITKRKEMDEILNRYATTDEMTETFNRRSGMLLIEKQVQLAQRHKDNNFVLFFMDVNGLKSVNDTLGHEYGDELIVSAVNVLKKCLRESDSVCRFGGDEFLIILPYTSLPEANIILQRIYMELEIINKTNQHAFILSISIGTSEFSYGMELTVDDLIRIADENMYKNKIEIKKKLGPKGVLR